MFKVNDYVVNYISIDSKVCSSTSEVVDEVSNSIVKISIESISTNCGAQDIVSGAVVQ